MSLYEQPPTSSLSNLEIVSKFDIAFNYVSNENFTINVSSLHLSWRPDFCIVISAVPPFHPIQTQRKMMHFQVSNQSSSFCVVNGSLATGEGGGREEAYVLCSDRALSSGSKNRVWLPPYVSCIIFGWTHNSQDTAVPVRRDAIQGNRASVFSTLAPSMSNELSV